MKNKFAQRLALIRKKSGLSQKQAAQKLGISQALLSHYEKGIRECGLDFVLKTAKVFEVPCDYLLGAVDKLPGEGDSHATDDLVSKRARLQQGITNVHNVTDLLYNITARFGNPKIYGEINNLLYARIYSLLRVYSHVLNDEKSGIKDMFTLDTDYSLVHSYSLQAVSFERIISRLNESNTVLSGAGESVAEMLSAHPEYLKSVQNIVESVESTKPRQTTVI